MANKYCQILFLSVLTYVSCNFLISYSTNYFKDTYEKFSVHVNGTSKYRDFVYPMWFPFDVSVSDGYYLITFFYQSYTFYSLMGSFWCIDSIVLSCIIHLRSQVKVISFALQKVDENIDDSINENQTVFVKKIRLVKCIQELNYIFRAADIIENLCNGQLLFQNGLAHFILCTLLYVTNSLTGTTEKLYMLSSAVIVLVEPFIQCWVCQEFSLEFSNVLGQIYELDWVRYPPEVRKMLIFTMARLQKPPVFTLGKWAKLNVSFYLNLLKMTYSFYTVTRVQALPPVRPCRL